MKNPSEPFSFSKHQNIPIPTKKVSFLEKLKNPTVSYNRLILFIKSFVLGTYLIERLLPSLI